MLSLRAPPPLLSKPRAAGACAWLALGLLAGCGSEGSTAADAAAGGARGDAGDGTGGSSTDLPLPASLEVIATLTVVTDGSILPPPTFPTQHRFALHRQGAGIVVGSDGSGAHAAVRAASGPIDTTEPFTLEAPSLHEHGCTAPAGPPRLIYESLHLTRSAAGCGGRATGRISVPHQGDSALTATFSATLACEVDVRSPVLDDGASPPGADASTEATRPATSALAWFANEPLSPGAALTLQGNAGQVVPLRPVGDDLARFVVGFVLPDGALWPGVQYALPVPRDLRDLAGNRATVRVPGFRVAPVPLLVDGTFESDLPVVDGGGRAPSEFTGELVHTDGTPLISGQRTLRAEGELLLRVRVPAGATEVALNVRRWGATAEAIARTPLRVRLSSPAGQLSSRELDATAGAPTRVEFLTGAGQQPTRTDAWALPATSFALPLPAGAPREVLLLVTEWERTSGRCPRTRRLGGGGLDDSQRPSALLLLDDIQAR